MAIHEILSFRVFKHSKDFEKWQETECYNSPNAAIRHIFPICHHRNLENWEGADADYIHGIMVVFVKQFK